MAVEDLGLDVFERQSGVKYGDKRLLETRIRLEGGDSITAQRFLSGPQGW